MNEQLKTVFDRLEDNLLYRIPSSEPISYAELIDTDLGQPDFLGGFATKHELVLKLGIRFIANDAEYSYARKIAETRLADALYSDVIQELSHIASMINNREYQPALAAVLELRARLRS